jgi:hypothetical protein
MGLTALVLPLLAWFPAPWTPIYWLAIFFRYVRALEKMLILGCLAVVILLGPLGMLATATARLAGDPTAQILLESAGRSHEPEAILALEELSASNPDDPIYPALLGGLYARGRFLAESLEQYRRASQLVPTDARIHNNIGNIFYRVGRHGEASQAYRLAIELDPGFLPPYLNLYLARQAMFDFRSAEEALQRGRAVNAEGIASLLGSRQSEPNGQEPLDSTVPRSEIWTRILSSQSWRGSLLGTVGAGIRSPISIAGIVSFVLALVLGVVRSKQKALLCERCGRAYCGACQAPSETPELCVQCRHLFVVREGLHPSVRTEKMEEIARNARNKRRLVRLVSMVLPGAGRMILGRSFGGLLLLFSWCVLWSVLATRGRGLVSSLPQAEGTALMVPVVLLIGLVWVAGNLNLSEKE